MKRGPRIIFTSIFSRFAQARHIFKNFYCSLIEDSLPRPQTSPLRQWTGYNIFDVFCAFRLEKKRKQREAQQKKKQQADTLRNIANTGAFVIGEITEWRITYGFLRINGIGDAFIHISDILGRPHISPGCRIRCKLQDQLGHPRPKAVQASLF